MPSVSCDAPPPSPASTASSFDDNDDDDDDANSRVRPNWPAYRAALRLRGFRLDTVQDVRDFYSRRGRRIPDYFLARHSADVNDALCPDAGLPDNLFRGTRTCDGAKVVIKAVHLQSREFAVIRLLSTPPLRDHPMNHCIPVLDLLEVEQDGLAFIVMEEWSSQLIDDEGPCCLRLFLAALRQFIEHVAFMHKHRIAHLDISLRNLVTDYKGNYAYIDYELSRRFNDAVPACISGFRTTEVPPECELLNGDCPDPFKADVWALAVLILRACKLAGYCVKEIVQLTIPMLNPHPENRPSMSDVLRTFDEMVPTIRDLDRLPNLH